jgi:branched-chain amino acid aminotransferase
VQDAQRRGFDEAILLNQRGEVSEGSGENIFVVKNGGLLTNDIDADILMGITRESIIEIARNLELPVRIGTITVEDVLGADELFFSGTAVEVTAIREVDGTVIGGGTPGPITLRLQQTFNEAVRGQRPEYKKWLAYALTSV